MEETKLCTTDIIRIGNNRYRVLGVTSEITSICKLDTSRLYVETCDTKELIEKIDSGEITIQPLEETLAFDINKLSETVKNRFQNMTDLVNEIKDRYAPLYNNLLKNNDIDFRKELTSKYNISESKFWRTIRAYLHSGFDPVSLIDKRYYKKRIKPNYKNKPGKKSNSNIKGVLIDDKVIEAFEYGLSLFKKKQVTTLKAAYQQMLKEYYMIHICRDGIAVLCLPEDGLYPSQRQFEYYVHQKLGKKDFEILKTSAAEYRNDNRPLYGDSLSGVYGPCDLWEVDACECDFELVSIYDRNIAIKRPTLYVIIDVFTRMIVAFSLSFEINSNRGFANCMMNLLEDKDELCKKYGINTPKKFWPDTVLPNRIRCDYGSEFISHDVERMCLELGITKENVTPGTGSLKPVVEQIFHQMNTMINQPLNKNGRISKKHGSKHYEEAKLNIEEAKSIVLTYIVSHNLKQLENYPLNKQMIKDGLSRCPTPLELWNYGIDHQGSPRRITDINRFKYALLEEKSASITRYGLTFMNLNYSSPLDYDLTKKVESAGKKRIKAKIRIDTRDLSYCYRIENNEIVKTPLSERTDSKTFAGWSLPEYVAYREQVNKAKKDAKVHNLNNEIIATELQKKTIEAAAKQKKGISNKKNINDNTRIEKEARRKDELIFSIEDILQETNRLNCPNHEDKAIDVNLSDAIESHNEKRYQKYYEKGE